MIHWQKMDHVRKKNFEYQDKCTGENKTQIIINDRNMGSSKEKIKREKQIFCQLMSQSRTLKHWIAQYMIYNIVNKKMTLEALL